MKIREVFITATNLDAAADFYRDVLELPVNATPDRVRIDIGTSRLTLTSNSPTTTANSP
ncbi:VOC family protein [Nocardia terpenica]|uniref:VOC family protein n=1 Tax=Nocardia terpenica TaxID=455432 RepID=UPI0002E42C9C|nr:VOC family protein [Nocardia terpenica]MBF6059835.1 VOC family protein [Nocardia terpenica]MBF6102624.1 VOC family protein [Nocardia terpenica]MBF6111185.1 VOC family protein [Nocardia terpenica]MBF6117316.1 VOC family protein [Nocardia terpenica]MBF6150843.1 VOC family protein [Nocardia terpenica]